MNVQPSLIQYLPHRPPMLLLDNLLQVGATCSESEIIITPDSSFFVPDQGVPAWIGLEYMGQTAATIAGYQLEAGTLAPHVGLLLGTRKYKTDLEWFVPGAHLKIQCKELNVMPAGVATFHCEILLCESTNQSVKAVATANLTVYRTSLDQ